MKDIKSWMIWSLIASLSSVLVVVFSFLLPAFQEQLDRAEAREVVESYVTIGERFFEKGLYAEAEKVFGRAFEFSENRRLDIELKRLKARIFKVYELEDWVPADFEELEEGDFLFLVETTKDPSERSEILGAFGVYKSLKGKKTQARDLLQEAVDLDPKNSTALVNLGNVSDDLGKKPTAEALYKQALEREPLNYEALYNLGMLYKDEGNCRAAHAYLSRALALRDSRALKKEVRECQ